MEGVYMQSLAIMTDNNVLQTKFIGYNSRDDIHYPSFTSNPFHIVIDNVLTNMETSLSDVNMNYNTNLYINNRKYTLWCTWTSTIKPDNVTVELDCEVVETSYPIITAKCGPDLWSDSVFNRIPILAPMFGGDVQFGSAQSINRVLFGTDSFQYEGSTTQSWDGSTRYNVTGSGTNLTINDQVTIKKLPTEFVNHWVDIGAEALMGGSFIMLVPHKSP